MSDRPIRILLVDDHELFRQGLRQLLATTDDLLVVGEAASGREAVELVTRLAPDVVLMDIAMPDLDGIATTEILRQRYPGIRIVMLTMYDAATHGAAARAAGASAYVVKSSRPEELFHAIRAAANGASPPPNGNPHPRPTVGRKFSDDDRLAHLERRLRWLESQLAELAARQAATPPAEPNGAARAARSVPAAPVTEEEAPPVPPSPPPTSAAPVAAPVGGARPTRIPRSTPAPAPMRRLLIFGAGTLAAQAVALVALLAPLSLPLPTTWVALSSGLAASVLLLTLAATERERPGLAHLVLLLLLASAVFWSILTTWQANVFLRTTAFAGLVLLGISALGLSWWRGFLLAAALALAMVALTPFLLKMLPASLVLPWISGSVGIATVLAWVQLRTRDVPVAWEWLPLAPLFAGLPLLLGWAERAHGMETSLLAVPWLVLVPLLWQATRAGRRSVTVVLLVAVGLLLGTGGWLLRSAVPATQAAALTGVAGGLALLALLLWKAAQREPLVPAPWETTAGLAVLTLAVGTARHPEPVVAPVAWCALAVLVAVSERRRMFRQWAAFALFLAGGLAALSVVLRSDDTIRVASVVAAVGFTTASVPFVVTRPRLQLTWLAAGALMLGLAATWQFEGVGEIGALSGLALAALLLARVSPMVASWRWLPAAGLGVAALLAALTGPLSPARLGLSLQPAVPATSEPIVAATILVAAALAAGRVLGRRWRWAAIATALLVVAYALPAVLPDAALVVSWLALAVALAHALGGSPWR
ncbi:response regulator transcription factor [Thermomicrobium sp. CFH 73360]|uniref:response regulator n=1 Tax=Thermomicrobium sp. CFH 73360 TaxID=2951987 RepID=UPI002077393E|nr:response regulator transcription factor [Thermomicrobium sp. CFH 73360]MCM8747016.1 response regulator transcription factor [Thermomicrobium sp. CFH 73360]